MSGMINAPAAGGMPPLSDPVLQEAEQKNEAGLNPTNRDNYFKIVNAGMAAAFTPGPNSLLAKLLRNPDPVQAAVAGPVALVLILQRETKGTPMPIKAMVPAAITLMLHALDLINRQGKVKVGAPELVRAAHFFAHDMFGAFNITPTMLHKATAQAHAITQNPQAMQAINLKLGFAKHPNAVDASAPVNANAPTPAAAPVA